MEFRAMAFDAELYEVLFDRVVKDSWEGMFLNREL